MASHSLYMGGSSPFKQQTQCTYPVCGLAKVNHSDMTKYYRPPDAAGREHERAPASRPFQPALPAQNNVPPISNSSRVPMHGPTNSIPFSPANTTPFATAPPHIYAQSSNFGYPQLPSASDMSRYWEVLRRASAADLNNAQNAAYIQAIRDAEIWK